MVLSQTVNVRVNGRTAKRYRELGYNFDHIGDVIEIPYTDLSRYSEGRIQLRCDYCGAEFSRQYSDHYTISHNTFLNGRDSCKKCAHIKNKETMQQRYGVDNPFNLESVRQKSKKTVQEKYGVECVSQCSAVRAKAKTTNLVRYGVEYASQSEIVKESVRKTNRERYGADYYMQTQEGKDRFAKTCLNKYGVTTPFLNPECKEKARKTSMERYGVEYPSSSLEVREKVAATKYSNSSQIASRQQIYLYNIIGGELNYPFHRYFIDIALPDERIAIEYNGTGHDLSVRMGQITESKFIQNENCQKKETVF